MTMIETAEIVAERYGISREAQDEYALRSQQRTAAAQQAGRFDDEIVPLPSVMPVTDRATGETSTKPVTLDKDEGNRPDTNAGGPGRAEAGVQGRPARQGRPLHHRRQRLAAVGRRLGRGADGGERRPSAAGCSRSASIAASRSPAARPDEMGIGPVFAVPKLLAAARAQDRRHRSVGAERGLRLPGHLLPRPARHPARQAQRQWRRDLDRPSLWHVGRAHGRPRADRGQAARRASSSSCTMCVGGGMGAAGLFEVA